MGVVAGVLTGLIVLPLACTTGVGARDTALWFQSVPADLRTPPLPQRSKILATDGSTLATFFFENRVEVRLEQVAPILRRAVLAVEDSRFYDHGALDSQGTMRALLQNLQAGKVTQGGSGITQQYVKNLLSELATTDADRRAALEVTPARKVRELRYAVALERRMSKDQILQNYLNIAYFGDGAYGIEAAARHYFAKSAARLGLAEGATLAGLVRYPHAYNPRLHPDAGRARRDVVLGRLAALGWISRPQADAAAREGLRLRVRHTPNGCVTSSAPFFCDYVQREMLISPVFGSTVEERRRLLERGGLTIRTTLDRKVQRAAQRAVDRRVPAKNSAGKAAAEALIEPGTGAIRGLAVDRQLGPDKERGKTWINFAADASHGSSIGMQAGSTFKVFTLARALEEGMPFGQRLMAPSRFQPKGYRNCKGQRVGDTRLLRNSADGEGGRTFSLLTGTHHSVNTFFLALERKVGLCDTATMAERLGMRQASGTALQQYPSFTLGFNTVSPVRMAAAYAAFAARGRYCEPVAISEITDATGRHVRAPGPRCRQAMRPGVADAVNHVLRGVLTDGTARGLGIGRPAAGKTGTVDNFSAAWFAGYTPGLAAAVWVGDPRGGYAHPMGSLCMDGRCYGAVFGATIPGPIWQDTMIHALNGAPVRRFHPPPSHYFSKGSGLDAVRVPDVLGLRPGDAARRLRRAGLRVLMAPERIESGKYKRGTIAKMSLAPRTAAEPGTVVTLSVSDGPPDHTAPSPVTLSP
jgi:membrane peptidoglycan carboxypeptidase